METHQMSTTIMAHEYLTEAEVRAWGGCLKFTSKAMQALDEALRRDHGISLNEFDVLITLYNAPNNRLRMTELSNRIVLTASGLTQLVTRLESKGLVGRSVDPADRRSFFAVLTTAGDQRLRESRQTHNEIIRSRLTRRLTPEQLDTLGSIWEAIAADAT